METAGIHSITRLRINSDGEGVRSVIFMQGCPLDCFWCCNPETRFGSRFRRLTVQQLYTYIREDIPYYLFSQGGLTFSGGEPLLWSSFIKAFAEEYCREFTVDLETSLYAPWENIEPLIPLVHLWNVDFKVFDSLRHEEYTGKSNVLIVDNLRRLVSAAGPEHILITYPVVPGYNDSQENISRMVDLLRELGITRIELHPYRKFAEEKHRKLHRPFREIPEISSQCLKQLLTFFRENGIAPTQRGTIFSKEKCEYLKGLRREICANWDLNVDIAECDITEGCIGTCQKCEQELHEISSQRDRLLLEISD